MHVAQLCVPALLLLIGACGGGDVVYECYADAGAAGGATTAVTLPELPGTGPVPAEATLCKLTLNVSTVDDVQAVLGRGDSNSSGDGSDQLFYEYANASVSIAFSFVHGVFNQAMVDNMPYPKCWTDEMPDLFPREPPSTPNP